MSVKKILALLLAAMMVFGMTSALADIINEPTTASSKFDIPISKTLYFKNIDSERVFEPNFDYEYEITGVTAAQLNGATVTDSAGNTDTIKPGDMRAISNPNLSLHFNSKHAAVTADPDGNAAVIKQNTVAFDATKIVSNDNVVIPGVYRYAITETSTKAEKNAVGIYEGSDTKVLYMDVFIAINETTKEPVVTGTTIHQPGTNPGDSTDNDINDDQTDSTGKEDETGKTTGFGGGDDSNLKEDKYDNNDDGDTDDTDDTANAADEGQKTGKFTYSGTAALNTRDYYQTYNVTVKKTVSGTMGDRSNYFPFEAVIAGSVTDACFDVTGAAGTAAKTVMNATGKFGDAAATAIDPFKLKDTESFKLSGIPAIMADNTPTTLTVTTNEFNNTDDTYKVYAKSVVGSATTNIVGTDTARTEIAAAAKTNASSVSLLTAATPAIEFDNKLDAVSPTGVVLRFAPFFAMFAAGCVLFLILATKRSKKEEE